MYEAFNENTTLRELLVKHPQTRHVFEALDIDYCCSGLDDLKTAAAEAGVPLPAVMESLLAALEAPPDAAERDWAAVTPGELVDHLMERHHAPLKHELPRLHELIAKVINAHPRHNAMLADLQRNFEPLKHDLDGHLTKEETVLFPLIRRMDAFLHRRAAKPEQIDALHSNLGQMEYEHEAAGLTLGKMREITCNYALPDDACVAFRALYDGLKTLEADLHEHVHLENNILFPQTVELEKAARKR